jgi:pimeloyl-ACP methyl ester carboxylesterase
MTAVMHHRRLAVGDVEVFYREAGDPDAPVLLLLHGFPSASHMFRRLIPRLAERYRCIAPDLPGFGHTQSPPAAEFPYTFDRLAETVAGFVDGLGLERYALYLFDFGAPTGFRLATARPEAVQAIIVQNGNAYVEGLSPETEALQAYWRDREANAGQMRDLLTLDLTRFQYVEGVGDPELLDPDAWTLDQHFLDQPGRDQAMLDLLYDYSTNVERYPEWQAYLRSRRPPLLITWGRHDPFFSVAGAEAYLRDVPDAELHLLDTGHFALETHDAEIAERIDAFLDPIA